VASQLRQLSQVRVAAAREVLTVPAHLELRQPIINTLLRRRSPRYHRWWSRCDSVCGRSLQVLVYHVIYHVVTHLVTPSNNNTSTYIMTSTATDGDDVTCTLK